MRQKYVIPGSAQAVSLSVEIVDGSAQLSISNHKVHPGIKDVTGVPAQVVNGYSPVSVSPDHLTINNNILGSIVIARQIIKRSQTYAIITQLSVGYPQLQLIQLAVIYQRIHKTFP